jgi:hypothetical protein
VAGTDTDNNHLKAAVEEASAAAAATETTATETAAMETVATVTAAVTAAVVPVDGASYMVGKVLQKSKTGY